MKMRKGWRWFWGIAAALLVYHFDAITGQWKFNRLCETEAGARYFEPVEGGVGWEVQANHDLGTDYVPALNLGAGFVRFTDKKGVRSDVRMTTPRFVRGGPKYSFSPVDEALPVRYRYVYFGEEIDGDKRFKRYVTQLVDLKNDRIAASHTAIVYAWTASSRVLLNAPTSQRCGSGEESNKFFAQIRNQGVTK